MSSIHNRSKVAFIASTEMTVTSFLANHIQALSKHADITVITQTNNLSFLDNHNITAKVIPLVIARKISIFQDFLSLIKLISIFKTNQYDLILSVTPKAGLLSMIAGKITSIPVRIHIFTGQVWATKTGFLRLILKLADKTIASTTTHALADSLSQKDFLEFENIVPIDYLTILAHGSICGVDLNRFKPNAASREDIRSKLSISDKSCIFLFLGRLNSDKGILDLTYASKEILKQNHSDIHLVFVGPDEDSMTASIKAIFKDFPSNLHFIGFTLEPEKFMAAADIFCLPSYREGFGSVIIEAAACGIPAVASRIYGLTDAVEENVTGLLHQVKDIDDIKRCLIILINNIPLRKQLGQAAYQRATTLFNQPYVTSAFVEYILNLLAKEVV